MLLRLLGASALAKTSGAGGRCGQAGQCGGAGMPGSICGCLAVLVGVGGATGTVWR